MNGYDVRRGGETVRVVVPGANRGGEALFAAAGEGARKLMGRNPADPVHVFYRRKVGREFVVAVGGVEFYVTPVARPRKVVASPRLISRGRIEAGCRRGRRCAG